MLALTLTNQHEREIDYTPASGMDGGVDATVALLGSDIVSAVRNGENAGRELHHDFSVLTFRQVTMKANGEGGFTAHVTLPKTPALRTSRRAIAFWVVRRGTMAPVQASGGWLNGDDD